MVQNSVDEMGECKENSKFENISYSMTELVSNSTDSNFMKNVYQKDLDAEDEASGTGGTALLNTFDQIQNIPYWRSKLLKKNII